MNRFRVVTVASALVMALLGAGAYAQAPEPGRRGGPGGGPGFGRGAGLPLAALNLTENQQEQVRLLIQQSQERLRADIMAVLTPEQQAIATKLQAEREARREQRGGRGR